MSNGLKLMSKHSISLWARKQTVNGIRSEEDGVRGESGCRHVGGIDAHIGDADFVEVEVGGDAAVRPTAVALARSEAVVARGHVLVIERTLSTV